MASHQSVQSRRGVRGGGRGKNHENEQQQLKYSVHYPLCKYVTKIGKREKNMSDSCLWNPSKCKLNFTGSYMRFKAHFLWLEGNNAVHQFKKIP
jgi:hypothetical protein